MITKSTKRGKNVMNFEKELSAARQIALEAGALLKGFLGRITQIAHKSETDLVTEADLQSEKLILESLGRRFPGDSVLTEESGAHGHGSKRVWLIDPLDGTINFAHELPFFAVSMGLQVEGETVVGVVYSPCTQECFEGAKGVGAFLNQRPITVSKTTELIHSLLATGIPYTVRQNPGDIFRRFSNLTLRSRGVRRIGSAALDLCYVAAGRFAGYWEQDLNPWDTAAGAFFVEEAGGRVTDFEGNPFNPFLKTILATNSLIHEDMMAALRL
ncbi:MAG: inositol monophosphatase [Desulfobacterota bacterium]|jgi:myo-inositol-1(or 4)-monophosphatase|nr:inositol monophosphatase [Thermodesulfobacteriota bacterium]